MICSVSLFSACVSSDIFAFLQNLEFEEAKVKHAQRREILPLRVHYRERAFVVQVNKKESLRITTVRRECECV